MKARAPRSLTPGVVPMACGGGAALMAFLRAWPRCAGSMGGQSFLNRLRAAAPLWARPAIVHVHTSARLRAGLDSLLLWLTYCAGGSTIVDLRGGARSAMRSIPAYLFRSPKAGTPACAAACGARVTVAPSALPAPRLSTRRLTRMRDAAGLRKSLSARARATVQRHELSEAVRGRLAATYNDLARV